MSESVEMSIAPRPDTVSSRMLLRSVLCVEPFWMFSAKRAVEAMRIVLLMTRLPVEGAPPSIW